MGSSAEREDKHEEKTVRPIYVFVCTHRSNGMTYARKLFESFPNVTLIDLTQTPEFKEAKLPEGHTFQNARAHTINIHNNAINKHIQLLPANAIVADITDFNLGHTREDTNAMPLLAPNLQEACGRTRYGISIMSGSGEGKMVHTLKKTKATLNSPDKYIYIDDIVLARELLQILLFKQGVKLQRKSSQRVIRAGLQELPSPMNLASPSSSSTASASSTPSHAGSGVTSPTSSEASNTPTTTPISTPTSNTKPS